MKSRNIAVVFLALVASGCAGAPKQEKFPGVVRVSQNGATLYFQAKQQYGVVRAIDPHGPPLAKAMDGILAQLDGAVTNDPKCPLFYGKRGEMFLELGPDGYGRAELDLKKALELSEDWIPAWIAMADLETRRNERERAQKWLVGAEKAIQVVEDRERQRPTPTFRIMGLSIGGEENKPKDSKDPNLAETERRQLLYNWLQESEQWKIDSPSLLAPVAGGTGASVTVNQSNLIRRFRARVEFQRIVARLRAGDKPAAVLPMFDRVFQWDADLFPARIEKSVQLRASGDYRAAERLMRPYIDSGDPKLANNARLLYEMGSIYTDWYVGEIKSNDAESISRLADQAFTRLFKVNPEHGPGWVKRAQLYAAAGTKAGNRKTLADAKQWLDNARESMGLQQDTEEMRTVRDQIERGEKALAARNSAPGGSP